MASKLFYNPQNVLFTSRSLPAGAAAVYFFYTGTTTLAPIYSDVGLTTPLLNPVTADGLGRLPNVYLDDTIIYRVRAVDSNGVAMGLDTDPYIAGVVGPGAAASSDAVTFTQSGTGTQTRTAQTKLRERLSINDFTGADPTGVGDSTAAINAAIAEAAASGRVVHVDGVYRYTSAITVPAGVILQGSGRSSADVSKTMLVKSFDGLGVDFAGDDSGARDIQFDCDFGGDTGDNVRLRGSRCFIDGCTFARAGRDGLRIGSDETVANANVFRVNHPICFENGRHGIMVDDAVAAPTDANGGVIMSADCRSNGADGIHVGAALWNTIIGAVCQANGDAGVRLSAATRATSIIGGDIEANGGIYQAVIENGAIGNTIDAPLYLVGRWTDLSPQGVNRIKFYSPNAGQIADGDIINIINPRAGGEAIVNLFADTNEANVASFRGRQSGGSGGTLDGYTKRDGDTPAKFLTVDNKQRARFFAALSDTLQAPIYGASVAIDAAAGGLAEVTATNSTAFAIAAPANPATGMRLTIAVRNTSGGALGALTWDAAFKMAAWTQPANQKAIAITFYYNGSNWVECARSGEVPL